MAKDELPEELRHFADTNMDDAPDPLAVAGGQHDQAHVLPMGRKELRQGGGVHGVGGPLSVLQQKFFAVLTVR